MGPVIDRAAFRTARGVLSTICGGPVDERSGVLLVASALPEEGRSTFAAATAAALASVGERVALVDAETHRPVQHQRLNLPEIGGLVAALDDPASVQIFMRTSHIDGFDLLPHGNPSADLRAKLAGPEMKELLAKLRETYTYIVIDAGPLLLSQEARLVAANCDAAVFVLHAEHTRSRHTAVAHALIKRMGLPIVGAVMNALPDDYRRPAFEAAAAPQEPSRRRPRALLPAPDDDADEHELHLA
jgi:receptor protein-tyrosine kinase